MTSPHRPWRHDRQVDETCRAARDVVSARLDGEVEGVVSFDVDDHFAGCAACTSFAGRSHELHRRLRVAPAPAVPDLRDRIVANVDVPEPAGPLSRRREARLVLGLAGLVQVLVALAGAMGPQPVHAVREVAAFEIALGIALVMAAWRPDRLAHGMLPLVTLAAGIVLGAAVIDVADGATNLVAEFSHVVPAIGAAVLWWLDRSPVGRLHMHPGAA
ncbi:zf-HC2 domain-containing protein [Salsipaludibacter albus]|uniref:zf-HC2 domain-containing protein n=1 Tax=Salsipaludibacter albus TaxID=2849650 RepID=UPI001EE3FC75|nr:zf-HC2 domain-containing protein [Salsipaludibacter albus]